MISICLASYNGGKFIREQIESILPQLSESDELIISDDGSKDDTILIIKSFNDCRIKLYHNKKHHGFIGNFENALSHAEGDYIFLCDQDDIWMPNKVEVVLNILKDCDLVVHNAELIDGKGNILNKDYYSSIHSRKDFISNLLRPRFLGCCMAFRKNVLDKALPFPNYRRGHDYWIGCIALLKYRVKFIQNKLICYRRHGHNVTTSSEKSTTSIGTRFFKRVDMLYSLILRLGFNK